MKLKDKEAIIEYENGKYVGTVNMEMEKNGFGKYTFHDGDIYEGEWLKDMKHGKEKNFKFH